MPDEIRQLPERNESTPDQTIVAARKTIATSWSGPLPPPEYLRAYEETFAGCAERIVAMAEADMQHLHSLERAEVDHTRLAIQSEIDSERRGMWLAFTLAVLGVILSGFLLYTGHLGWGVGLVSAELITLAGLFIFGRSGRPAE